MTAPAPSFDSLSYWRTRHDRYLSDSKGVGNAALDTAHNDRIYAAIEKYVGDIAAHLKTRGARRVLDLGCGIGMLANAFVAHGLEYTGVDISETAVGIASANHPRARFLVGNIASLPFTELFDIVIERTVFIHLVEDDYWKSTLRQVKRSLAPGGAFILIDHLPRDAASAPQSAAHVKFRLLDQYEREFAEVGLQFDPAVRTETARHVALNEHTHMATHR
jgi:SAM-dependent methyltransferase